jgi:hypothetical protein
MAEQDVDHCIADYRLIPVGHDPLKGLVNLGRLDDVRRRGTAFSRNQYALAFGMTDDTVPIVKFSSLIKRHREVSKHLRDVWHAKPTRKSLDDCMSRWEDLSNVEVFAPLGAYTGPGMPPSEDVLNEHAFLAFPLLLANSRRLASAALDDHWEFSLLLGIHLP